MNAEVYNQQENKASSPNGQAEQPSAKAPGENGRSEMEQAEEMVDHLAQRVAELTSIWGRKLLWLGVRAREEAEDIWAEAQNIRRAAKS